MKRMEYIRYMATYMSYKKVLKEDSLIAIVYYASPYPDFST
jgi:hypothetical protein